MESFNTTVDFAPGSVLPDVNGLDAALLAASVVLALSFSGYLMRCYLQELRQHWRVSLRKKRLRSSYRPHLCEPLLVLGRQNSTPSFDESADSEIALAMGKLDPWRVHFLMPSHDRITIVWESPGNEQPSVEFYVPRDERDATGPPRISRRGAGGA